MYTKGFVIVTPESGDWEALYMNGKLIAEGHSLSSRHILQAISDVAYETDDIFGFVDALLNGFVEIEVSDEIAERGFSDNLNEVLEELNETVNC